MPIKTLEVGGQQLRLDRFPAKSPDSLQAWESADVLLIEAAMMQLDSIDEPEIWILNDSFGAITTALHRWQPKLISDSFVAHQACRRNYQLNQLNLSEQQLVSALELPPKVPDLVLFKVPKTLAFFEYQLSQLVKRLTPQTQVLGAVMCKQLQRSMIELIERQLGPCQPSLAQRKARLLPCTLNPNLAREEVPELLEYPIAEYNLQLTNHANLFCRERLDIGTRFLLENLPKTLPAKSIVDLACGNGILGIVAAQRAPGAKICFADESYMAIASAEINANRYLQGHPLRFSATHCLEGIESDSADLVLNNPPFHQQHVVGDFIAREMFKEAFRVLQPGGKLLVVANRQLGYHKVLSKLFGNCNTLKGNPKFVLLEVEKAV